MKPVNVFYAVTAALFVGGVVNLITSLLIWTVLSAAAGALLVLYLLARAQGKTTSELAKQAAQQATKQDNGSDERRLLTTLVDINLNFRINGDVSPEVLAELETLINSLRSLWPRMSMAETNTTHQRRLHRLAHETFPASARKFLSLSSEGRESRTDDFQTLLRKWNKIVRKVEDNINNGLEDDFEIEASTADFGL